MKYFRKLICYFFGHRSIMTYIDYYYSQYDNQLSSNRIDYQCERCGHVYES